MGNCNNFCRAYDPENVSNISKLQEIEDALSKEIIKENEKEVKSSKIYAKTSKNFYTMKEGSENKLYDEKKNSTLISFHADSDEDHKSTSSQYSQRQNKKFIPKATRYNFFSKSHLKK